MAATQKDIAKKAGLSPSLVSRVLSGRAKEVAISEETIKRVQDLAEKMGYVPNTAAQSLKGISPRAVGVMVSYFNDPFFSQIIDTLLKRAEELDYSVLLSGFHPAQEPSARELRPLLKHTLDGVIVIGSSEHVRWIKEFSGKNIPVVRVGHGPADEFSTRIAIDENRAMKMILEHLKQNGCRRIAFAGQDSLIARTRQAAVIEHAKNLKVVIAGGGRIEICDNIPSGIADAADQLVKLSPLPDAVICATDKLALYLINELVGRGLSVPEDLAIIGVDDIPFAHLLRPRLTTIRQPVPELVAMAFDAIIHHSAPREIILEPELIVRESSLHTPRNS